MGYSQSNKKKDSTTSNDTIEFSISAVPPDGGGTTPTPTSPPPPPPIPKASTNSCGPKTLSVSGTKPSGVTWYWQGTNSNGYSMNSYGSTYSAATPGTNYYYIRAHNRYTDLWSTGSSKVLVTVTPYPAPPVGHSVTTNVCGPKTIYKGSPPAGITYFWQETSSGTDYTSVTATNHTKIVNTTGTYYLRARDMNTGCWSTPATAIYVTVNPYPQAPTAYSVSTNQCGKKGITKTAATDYWQGTNSNGTDYTSTTATNAIFTVTSSGTYYLRTRTSEGCWGPSQAIPVTINDYPTPPPALTVSDNTCGNKSVVTSFPETGSTYFWQGNNAEGMDETMPTTSNGEKIPYTASSTGVYYVRAKNNSNGCWSTSTGVFVSVIPAPSPPTANHTARIGKGHAVFQASGGSSTTYHWYNSSGTRISPVPSKYFTLLVSSTTTLYAVSTNSNGCESSRMAVTATVYSMPEVQASGQSEINFQQEWVNLTTNLTFDSYQWYKDGTFIEGATQRSYRATEVGEYRVSVSKSGVSGKVQSDGFFVKASLQKENKNYTISTVVLAPGAKTREDVVQLPLNQKVFNINYADGLGRSTQEITLGASPTGKDIIQPYNYDPSTGRLQKSYLPYTRQDGSGLYEVDWATSHAAFYQNAGDKVANSTAPFAEVEYENSPLERVKKSGSLGEEWQLNAHSSTFSYLVGDGTENIRRWQINTTTGLPVATTVYASGELTVNTIVDAQGNETKVYADAQGRTVLKKQALQTLTCFIYDDLGRLSFVLQPELVETLGAAANPTQIQLNQLAFQYQYDQKNRPTGSQMPGSGWQYLVYDYKDRAVLAQTVNQRASNEWMFVKYDEFNRPVLTGLTTISGSRQIVQDAVDAFYANTANKHYEQRGATVHGYSNQSYPSVSSENNYTTVVYYDDYEFPHASAAAYTPQFREGFPSTVFNNVKGLTTGGKVKVLGSNTWLQSVTYYDNRYKVIQSVKDNHLEGKDRVFASYDFTGKLLQSLYEHNGGNTLVLKQEYEYDKLGRLMQLWQTINGNRNLLGKYEYNELSQLIDKKIHSENAGASFLQSVDIRYTIQGWISSFNNSALTPDAELNDDADDLFGMEMAYGQSMGTGNILRYDGSITGVKWGSRKSRNELAEQRAYNYSYDALGRINQADYKTKTSTGWQATTAHQLHGVQYYKNGNIKNLSRRDAIGQQLDALTYVYQGNRLLSVSDTGDKTRGFTDGSALSTEYAYNAAGSMTSDLNKGISQITYNHLNLPLVVQFSDGRKIENTYDAGGAKITQTITLANGEQQKTDYVGNLYYENGQLKYFQHGGGRTLLVEADNNPGSLQAIEQQYHISDHQGNVRLTFSNMAVQQHVAAHFEDEVAESELFSGTNELYPKGPKNIVSSTLLNRTPGGSKVMKLNLGDEDYPLDTKMVLLKKKIAVQKGDVITLEVYAKYLNLQENNDISADQLLMALGGGAGYAVGIEASTGATTITSSGGIVAFLGGNRLSGAVPQAFLKYYLLNASGDEITSGKKPVSQAAAITSKASLAGSHERLYFQIIAEENGYLSAELSHEQDEDIDVYFDDFSLQVQRKGLSVVQQDDYTPFGLRMNSYLAEGQQQNKLLYNAASEWNETSGFYETFYRSYDPALGRFHAIDPYAGLYLDQSPYNYGLNNPITFNDPTGGNAARQGLPLLGWDSGPDQTGGGGGGHDAFSALRYLYNNTMYGGSWEGGRITTFKSDKDAMDAGDEYHKQHNSWAETVTRSRSGSINAFRRTSGNAQYGIDGRWRAAGKNGAHSGKWVINQNTGSFAQNAGGVWFDKQGEQLFDHWRNGNGRELILNDDEWGDYMRAHTGLRDALINEIAKNYPNGGDVQGKMHYQLSDRGGYRTGYQLLGGVNRHVGGLQYSGFGEQDGDRTHYSITVTWNDIMNPNHANIGDTIGEKVFPGTDYVVRITWTFYFPLYNFDQ